MINIAEILKNAPQGLKLYSLAHGDVTLKKVNSTNNNAYPIVVFDSNKDIRTFTKYGKIFFTFNYAECVLFPSKENRIWNNWQEVLFQRGDVITVSGGEILLFNSTDYAFTNKAESKVITKNIYRYATPEECDQFFKELNANGYTWNDNTKQMEKSLQQDKYKDECLGCVDTRTKKKQFTIDMFKPFDKVLVKYDSYSKWGIDFFERYDYDSINNTPGPYICLSSNTHYCIIYNNETAHLLGTNDDCPDKYKTW